MGITRGQSESPQSLKLRVSEYRSHERLAVAATAVLGKDKDIHKVGKRGAVRDDTGKRHLSATKKSAKAKRVLNRCLNQGQRNALGPRGVLGEETMNELDVQLSFLSGYTKIFHCG